MTVLERRLEALERATRRETARRRAYDLNRLTDGERADLDAIDARYGLLPRRRDGRLDLSAVSDADLATLRALAAKAKV